MSTFLKPEAFLLPAGVTQATIQSTIDGKLIAQGWQRITNDTVNFISDFIPPTTETTGDGRWRQVARIYYNTADISLSMYDYPITDAVAQMFRLSEKTGGAVANAVSISSGTTFAITASCATNVLTVTATAGVISVGSPIYLGGIYRGVVASLGTGTGGNGTYILSTTPGTVASTSGTAEAAVTVTGAAGSAGSTAKDNLAALYVALKQSADPITADWNITYLPGVAGLDSILMERKTISLTLATLTPNANVIGTTQMDPIVAGAPTAFGIYTALAGKMAFSIDRTNGFYVYMSIFSRSFHFGIKTTTTYNGIGGCYWMPNADAVASIPMKPMWLINPICRIQEGFYYYSNGSASAPAATVGLRSPNTYGVSYAWFYQPTTFANVTTLGIFNAGGGGAIPGQMMSWTSNAHYNSVIDTWTAFSTNIFQGGSQVSDVVNVAVSPLPYSPGSIATNYVYMQANQPAVYLEDVFVASIWNNDASEVTEVAGMPSPSGIALAQDLDATTAYTSILLNITTGLASTGTNFVVIDQEVFSYTGVSGGNTLTGVTRGYNATTQRAHFTGQTVLQGGWFVKINGGFLYMGTNRPTAT